jgi:hypothetical protein
MPSKKTLRAALIMGAVAALAVTPLAPAAAASGGGCDNWTHFTEYVSEARSTNGKGCISYSDGRVRPDAYINFQFRKPERVSACKAQVLVYKKEGEYSILQAGSSRTFNCRTRARDNETGVYYPAYQIRTSSGEYWTVLKVTVTYGPGDLFIHSGSPHVKP